MSVVVGGVSYAQLGTSGEAEVVGYDGSVGSVVVVVGEVDIGGVLFPVTTIDSYAFQYNQLTEITLPESLTNINNYAFASNWLAGVALPEGLTTIGSYAFWNNLLAEVTFPESLTTINGAAFQDNQLTEITLPKNLTTINNYAFADNPLTKATLNGPAPTIQTNTFPPTIETYYHLHNQPGYNTPPWTNYPMQALTYAWHPNNNPDIVAAGTAYHQAIKENHSIPADTINIQRNDGNGDGWITIAVDLDPETSVVDRIPRLGTIQYRAISRTNLPTARTGPETVTEPPAGLWPVFLNGGPNMDDVIAIYDNTQLAFERARAKTRHQWTREYPVTKWGQARSKTVALTATVSPESPGSNVADIEALEDIAQTVCVRDILGHKTFVTIDSVSSNVERDGRWTVSIPMTREHYVEGVS